jgi:uncharacterized protein YciI
MPYFIVIRERGPDWDWSRAMRQQQCWNEHAAFMDRLADERYILAGGPIGDEDSARRVMHVIESSSASEIEERMAEDPWTPRLLVTVSIERWNVLLGGFGRK